MAHATDVELAATRSDVLALREALEVAQREAGAAVQRISAERKGEIDQLQATVTALRDEMIRQRDELQAAVQAAERIGATEAAQLREAVVAARQHADELQRRHDRALAHQTQSSDMERRELQATIVELRRQLEVMSQGERR